MKDMPGGERRAIRTQKFIWWFVFVSLALSIVYVLVEITLAPSVAQDTLPTRIKSDYVLMLSQCVLGVLAMFLPSILQRRLRLIIPSYMIVLYTMFLYGAIFLGEVRNFYYEVPHWDTVLHALSGAMLGSLGFSFVNFFNKTEHIPVSMSPAFVAVFTFCFGITLGVVWEIYEFACDGILGTNMQKFALETGVGLVGRLAVIDTMKDLILDMVGALLIAVVGYVSLKFKKGWVEKLVLKFRSMNDD